MTRENKLALVVGFGLILFVGILISDHFSIARSQQPANMSGKIAINDPLDARPTESTYFDPMPVPPPKPAVEEGLIARDPQNANNASRSLPPSSLDELRPEHIAKINEGGLTPRGPAITDPISPDSDVTPLAGGQSKNEAATSTLEPDLTPAPPIVAPNVKFHDVKPKESLFAICRQHYGDASLVKALAKYNKIDDPTAMKVGRRLLIPSAEELGGAVPKSPSAPNVPSLAIGGGKPSTTPKPKVVLPPNSPIKIETEKTLSGKNTTLVAKTYTVKPGDSLTGIAQKVLGSKTKWRKLADINSGVIDDEDNLRVGTVLKLQ